MTAIESPAKTHLKIFKDFFQLFLLKCISESMYGYVHHVSAVPGEGVGSNGSKVVVVWQVMM